MDTKEFKSENLTLTVKFEPGCRVTCDVHVGTKGTEAAYKKAIKTVNKEVSLPGFRKGKAPEAIITQNYGSHVEREWKDILLQTAFGEALDLSKLYPLNKESVKNAKIPKASLEEGSDVHFEMEIFPDIPEVNPKDLHFTPVELKKVTEKDINDSFEAIHYQHAKWNAIEDRPVEEGDFVLLDVVNIGEPEQPSLCEDLRFEVLKGKMGDWMRKLLIGLKVGESAEGMSELDENTEIEEEFIPTQCKITVKAIQSAELPELNEEFAKKFKCNSIEELKKRIEEDLQKQVEEGAHEEERQQMKNLLLEKYPFDIPLSMLETEKNNRLKSFEEQKQTLSEKEIEELSPRYTEEKVAEDSLLSLRLFFLVRNTAEKNKIEVTEEEFLQELSRQLYSPQGFEYSRMEPERVRSKLYLGILERKTHDFLIEQAKAVDHAA